MSNLRTQKLAKWIVAGLIVLSSSVTAASPVEYVKVCSLYGDDFFYVPGTDTCVNVFTGETREQTAGGVWQALAPEAAGQWEPNAQAACTGGRVATLGTISSLADLHLNAYGIYESNPATLDLASGDFIAKVMVHGGITRQTATYASGVVRFTGTDSTDIPQGTEFTRADSVKYITTEDASIGDSVSGQVDIAAQAEQSGPGGVFASGTALSLVTPIAGVDGAVTWVSGFDSADPAALGSSSLCMLMVDLTPASGAVYSVLGCKDVTSLVDQDATWSFTPRRSVPPGTFAPPGSIVANAQNWEATSTLSGSLALSLCIRNTHDTGTITPCTVVSGGNGTSTITCGTTAVVVHDGANGTNGTNGIDGTNGTNGANGLNGTNGINGAAGGSCTVTDNGDGTVRMTCPDGTTADLLTRAAVKTTGSSCASGPDAGILSALGLLVLARRAVRRRGSRPALQEGAL